MLSQQRRHRGVRQSSGRAAGERREGPAPISPHLIQPLLEGRGVGHIPQAGAHGAGGGHQLRVGKEEEGRAGAVGAPRLRLGCGWGGCCSGECNGLPLQRTWRHLKSAGTFFCVTRSCSSWREERNMGEGEGEGGGSGGGWRRRRTGGRVGRGTLPPLQRTVLGLRSGQVEGLGDQGAGNRRRGFDGGSR